MFNPKESLPNPLWSDILAQPANLDAVVQHLYGAERARLEAAADFLRNERPIALIGVASAAYLCHPAETYLCARGRFASVLYAADALYTHLPALQNANVVINTRSGETAEIVRLGQALRQRGIPFMAITNEPQSTLAQMADHILWCNTRKDDLVSINVVSGMMTATLALAAAALGELDQMQPVFAALPSQMELTLEQALRRAADLYASFAATRPIHLLYRGALKGAAYNSRLVLEEIARTPAAPIEAAEFRQGPNEVVDERFGAVIFAPAGKPGALNLALAGDLRRSGGTVWTVGPGEADFALPAAPDAFLPVLALPPLQVLAYHLAQAQGYVPGQARYITKVILSEQGIPNQERGLG